MISMNFTVMTALNYCSLESVVIVVKAECYKFTIINGTDPIY